MDPALIELYEDGAPDDVVSVILRLARGPPPPGVTLVARFGPIATCRLRRGDIPSVRRSIQVLSMKAARLYGPSLDAGDVDGGFAEDAFEPTPADRRRPEGPLPTGAGVVVCHIDWGLDVACPAFRKSDGSTRLLALWDQSAPYDPARPNPYGYGRIHTREAIDAALQSGEPYRVMGYAPWTADSGTGSHGTHTTSISCGNGRDGGPAGIAPEADILFVDLSTRTADGPSSLGDSVAFLEGLDFAARTAGDRPIVVNASLGRQAGPKDGLTLTEQGIDAFMLAAPGRIVAQSAGNYFAKEAHTSRQLAPGATAVLHLELPTGRGEAELDLWYRGADRLGVILHGPDGVAQTAAPSDTRGTVLFKGREVGRLYHRLDDPNNHDNQVSLILDADAPPGDWELRLTGDHVADGRVHAWIERAAPGAQRRMRFVADEVRTALTLGTISTGFWSLTVGAYDVRSPDRVLGAFSSSGPTRDHRRLKPLLVAPGVRVLGSRSRPRRGEGPPLVAMSGTSMAAPHVTGAAALVLAAAPRSLGVHEVRALLTGTADPPPPDAPPAERLRLGAGYLDIAAAVAAAAALAPRAAHPAAAEAVDLDMLTAEDAGGEAGGEGGVWDRAPEWPAEAQDGMRGETQMERSDARSRSGGFGAPPFPPFQFQIPLGGGPAGLALPIGGPFAVSVPLGGSAAPTQVVVNTPAPASAATASSWTPTPVAGGLDLAMLAGTPDALGESVAYAHARTPAPAHSAAAFSDLAAELDDDAPASQLSATRLFQWLARDGADRLAQRIEGALPGGRLEILALPNTPTRDLAFRVGDLMVRSARGEGFGWVSVVADPVPAGVDRLAGLGWRGEGDPAPPPGRYVRVIDLGPAGASDPRPLARRLANAAGLVPPDTLLLRLVAHSDVGEVAEGGDRPTLRRGSTGDAVRELQGALNTVHGRRLADGSPGLPRCPLSTDGSFGPDAAAAVRAFQRLVWPDAPANWDGVVGPNTWTALDRAGALQGAGAKTAALPVASRSTSTATRDCRIFDGFALNSVTIPTAQRDAIRAYAAELIGRNVPAVDLSGHASPDGSASVNFGLGERRAASVADLMREVFAARRPGGPHPRLSLRSEGATRVISADGARNRRVEACVLVQPPPHIGPIDADALKALLSASMLLASDGAALFTREALPAGAQSGTIWTYELAIAGGEMLARNVSCKVEHAPGMVMSMPVLERICWRGVAMTLTSGAAPTPLTLDPSFLLGSFTSTHGGITAAHPFWKLPATLDVGTCAVFAYDLSSGTPAPIASLDQLSPAPANASAAPWALVCCELVCNTALNDFEPTGAVDVARVYPLIEVLTNVAGADIHGAVALRRPARSPMNHHWGNGGEHLVGLYADRNEGQGLLERMVALGTGRTGVVVPTWDDLFDYVDRDAAAASQSLTVVDPARSGTRRDTSGGPAHRRTLDRTTEGLGDTTVVKLPRQGDFDNTHIAPPMGVGPLVMPPPPLPFAGSFGTLPATVVSMAPLCAHDCFHMHWRWSRQFNGLGQLGWGSRGPSSEAGAPLVAPNQTVRLLTTAGVPGLDYRVVASAQPQNSWALVMPHGAGYAVRNKVTPSSVLEVVMSALHMPDAVTRAIIALTGGAEDAMWAWIYFFLQKWPRLQSTPRLAPLDVLDVDLPFLRRL